MTGRCSVMSGSGGLKFHWSRLHDRLEAAMAKKEIGEEGTLKINNKSCIFATAADLVGLLSQIHTLIL